MVDKKKSFLLGQPTMIDLLSIAPEQAPPIYKIRRTTKIKKLRQKGGRLKLKIKKKER